MYAEVLPQLFDETFARVTLPNLTKFFGSSSTARWILASDFVNEDPKRKADVFAMTFIPRDNTLDKLFAEINAASRRDIKSATRGVSPKMLDLLREPRRFHFVLVADRRRNWPGGVPQAQAAIEETLRMMCGWEDAARQSGYIGAMRSLRVAANANNFKHRLFGDIALVAAVAGYLSALLVRARPVTSFTWAPDRDKVTTAYGMIASTMSHINFSALCYKWRIPDAAQREAGFGFFHNSGRSGAMWFDPLIRIPDYLAGAVAAWDIDENQLLVEQQKYRQVLRDAIADNPNIEILRLRAHDDGTYSLARVITTKHGVSEDGAGQWISPASSSLADQ